MRNKKLISMAAALIIACASCVPAFADSIYYDDANKVMPDYSQVNLKGNMKTVLVIPNDKQGNVQSDDILYIDQTSADLVTAFGELALKGDGKLPNGTYAILFGSDQDETAKKLTFIVSDKPIEPTDIVSEVYSYKTETAVEEIGVSAGTTYEAVTKGQVATIKEFDSNAIYNATFTYGPNNDGKYYTFVYKLDTGKVSVDSESQASVKFGVEMIGIPKDNADKLSIAIAKAE